MIDGIFFEDYESFYEWYKDLNPNEPVDRQESMSIYFNLDIYGDAI